MATDPTKVSIDMTTTQPKALVKKDTKFNGFKVSLNNNLHFNHIVNCIYNISS